MNMPTFEVIDPKTGEKKTCIALIRKLTEKECFRLMGVDDEDIDKIAQSGVCRSEQYKLAGNSIVVDVLTKLFEQGFIKKSNPSQQMSIFDVL